MDNENLTEEESQRIAYMIEHLDEYPEFPVKPLNDEDNKRICNGDYCLIV